MINPTRRRLFNFVRSKGWMEEMPGYFTKGKDTFRMEGMDAILVLHGTQEVRFRINNPVFKQGTWEYPREESYAVFESYF